MLARRADTDHDVLIARVEDRQYVRLRREHILVEVELRRVGEEEEEVLYRLREEEALLTVGEAVRATAAALLAAVLWAKMVA